MKTLKEALNGKSRDARIIINGDYYMDGTVKDVPESVKHYAVTSEEFQTFCTEYIVEAPSWAVQTAYEAVQALYDWCVSAEYPGDLWKDLQEDPSAVSAEVETLAKKYGVNHERSSFNEDGYYLYREAADALSDLVKG